MSDYQIEGQALRQPQRTIHKHSWQWAREGSAWAKVTEIEGKQLLMMTTQISEPAAAFAAAEYLLAIVEHRLDQGWLMVTMDASSAVLKK